MPNPLKGLRSLPIYHPMAISFQIDAGATESGPGEPVSNLATELVREFSVPEPDLDRIVQMIDSESGLAAEVLRRSNSVVFAGHTPTLDVFEAVTRLGLLEVRDTILTFIDPFHAWSPRPATNLPVIRELFSKFKAFRNKIVNSTH